MTRSAYRLTVALAVLALASCTSAQVATEPSTTGSVNPITGSTLQFVVGTAMIELPPSSGSVTSMVGLNTLTTLRQNTGGHVGTSVLSNAPTIVGPATFRVPKSGVSGKDAGTNKISGTLQTSLVNPPPASTFNQADCSGNPLLGIASSSGFMPSAVSNPNNAPLLVPYGLPFYAPNASDNTTPSGALLWYIGGPPEFVPSGHTSTQDGTYSFPNAYPCEVGATYPGFTLGFDDFLATPVAGTYTLSVVIPTNVGSDGAVTTGTKTLTATLHDLTPLPAWSTPPAATLDGTGGATVATNFTANDPRITEEFIEVVNLGPAHCQLSGTPPYYYTFRVTAGQKSVTVPDNMGAAPPGTAQPHTFCTASENQGSSSSGTADGIQVYGFAADYPLAESSFPRSDGQISPTLTGPQGQVDITASYGNPPSSSSSSGRFQQPLR